MVNTQDSAVQNLSSAFSSPRKSTEDECALPTMPTTEDAYGLARDFANTTPDRAPLYSPSHISELGLRKPATAHAVTNTANHQIISWLLLCPIPLPDHLKKGLAAHLSRKESETDGLLSILLRCLESIRMRVSEIRAMLCDKTNSEMGDRSHCCCNEHGRLEKFHEQSQIQQSEILAKCQHLLELCLHACGPIKVTSPLDSGIAPSDIGENCQTMNPEASSGRLPDRETFCLNVSPLDMPKEKAVSRAGKNDEDSLRQWELDLMMANFSQGSNESILAGAEVSG